MILERLLLTHFKNYKKLDLEFSAHLNCLVGNNGMGKTNILDAIYYLCMARSNFALNDRNVVQLEESFFRIEGIFKEVGRIVAKVIPGKQKIVENANVPYQKLSQHIGLIPVVMIVPDDTLLVNEGSEARRRFLDNTISQLSHSYLNNLIRYNKTLKQKNAALKEMGRNGYFDEILIKIYNDQLLAPAQHIHAHRQSFMEDFLPVFTRYYEMISGHAEKVSIEYSSKLNEETFEDLLNDSLDKERILQRSAVGIHKDDLKLILNQHTVKRFASQGQTKSFVLALKLAQYDFLKLKTGKNPLLLLDDIFDKLDEHRVEQLIALLLNKNFGQIFITDTHEDRLEKIVQRYEADYKKFKVHHGSV